MADGPAGFRRGFPCPAVLRIRLGLRMFSATGPLPSMAGRSRPLRLTCLGHIDVLQPRPPKGPVWAPPRSLAATDGITSELCEAKLASKASALFSFPPGTEMFQFPGCASDTPMDSEYGDCL